VGSIDLIDTLKGQGIGISKTGETPVEYELNIYQHRINVGDDDAIPTWKEFRGWIRPVFGDDDEMLTLEFNDRSALRFSFSDKKGNAIGNGEILRPA
jgi:hypothetical protein